MNEVVDKLTKLFMRFPGIGPRQARRFVYFLLSQDNAYIKEFIDTISILKERVIECASCNRYFQKSEASSDGRCAICVSKRDETQLMLVEKDIDLEQVEKTGEYKGYYFVLGNIIPVLEKEPEKRIRQKELLKKINGSKSLKEIIIALSAHTEGDNTIEYLKSLLKKTLSEKKITLTVLGRGLSTGTELEYSDSDTLKNALANRA